MPNLRYEHIREFKPDETSQFAEDTRCFLRNLVDSPQFWRVTTTMHQLDEFCRFYDGKEKHGTVNLIKRAGEPGIIIFYSPESTKKFFDYMMKPIMGEYKNDKACVLSSNMI